MDNLIKGMKKLNRLKISVGVLSDSKRGGDGNSSVSNADVYRFNDQGTVTIPKRETLIPSVKKVRIRKYIQRIISTGATIGVLSLESYAIALSVSAKSELFRVSSPPLSPVTLAKRRGSNPLIDTKQLYSAITHKVR